MSDVLFSCRNPERCFVIREERGRLEIQLPVVAGTCPVVTVLVAAAVCVWFCLFRFMFVSKLILWILKNFAVEWPLCGKGRGWIDVLFPALIKSSVVDWAQNTKQITILLLIRLNSEVHRAMCNFNCLCNYCLVYSWVHNTYALLSYLIMQCLAPLKLCHAVFRGQRWNISGENEMYHKLIFLIRWWRRWNRYKQQQTRGKTVLLRLQWKQ